MIPARTSFPDSWSRHSRPIVQPLVPVRETGLRNHFVDATQPSGTHQCRSGLAHGRTEPVLVCSNPHCHPAAANRIRESGQLSGHLSSRDPSKTEVPRMSPRLLVPNQQVRILPLAIPATIPSPAPETAVRLGRPPRCHQSLIELTSHPTSIRPPRSHEIPWLGPVIPRNHPSLPFC